MMDIIVVTGGIGSGKSEVCRIIQEYYGCGVYCADTRVKELYDACPGLLGRIEAALDIVLRNSEGHFVPKLLADVIFTDRKALETVENLVFPALEEDFASWAAAYSDSRFVVFESATILEKPQLKGFGDRILLVDAPFETRLERACQRDSAQKRKILERMRNQTLMNSISEGLIQPEVDAVIYNTGSLPELKLKVKQVIDDLYNTNI